MIDRADWLDTSRRGPRQAPDHAGALLPILHAIQEEVGYIPPEAVPLIAE